MNNIVNAQGAVNSLQISYIDDIPEGTFKSIKPFLVKNITDENVTVSGILSGSPKVITTVLYPGWNVELFREIRGVIAKQLQYGF